MTLCPNRSWIAVISIGLTLALTQFASAQRGRGFFGASRVQLATLDKVQAELKLTDEQKKLAVELNEKLNEDRRELFQGGVGGDFNAMRVKMEKMNAEASAKLTEELDEGQQKRLTELYVQVNGSNALLDEHVGKLLTVTEEQQKKLASARDANSQAMRDAFQDFANMSDEERREAGEKLRKEADERLLAVLSDEQREQFGKLKGKEIELDTSQLFGRRGGGGRRGAGGNRPE